MSKLMKKVLSVVLLGSMVLSIASCAKKGVRSITKDQFEKAIMDAHVMADKNDFFTYTGMGDGDTECVSFGNDIRKKDDVYYNCVVAYLWTTDSEEDAKDMFDEVYASYYEASGVFDGKETEEFKDEYCYFTLDGTINDYPMYGYCYGGWYWAGNSFIVVYTTEDNDDHRGRIDSILEQLGFPTPNSGK